MDAVARSPHRRRAPGAARPRSRRHLRDQPRAAIPGCARPPGHEPTGSWILDQIFPADRAAPLVTVLDGHPHTLALPATINRVRTTAPGMTRLGQSGSLEDACRHHGLDADSIIRAALDLASSIRSARWQVNGCSLVMAAPPQASRPRQTPAPPPAGAGIAGRPPAFWHCGWPLACAGLAGFRHGLSPRCAGHWPGQRTGP